METDGPEPVPPRPPESAGVPSLEPGAVTDDVGDHSTEAFSGRPNRFLTRYAGTLVILTILCVSALYLAITIPWDLAQLKTAVASGFHDHGMTDWIIKERVVEVLLFWWVVSFGASVGSFLNVVVYRMPLGMSLSAKGSHCVWCKARIPGRDNIPILGWILLRGRCRTCRLPISGRYPLVESLTAGVGLILFLVTVQMRGWGLAPFSGQAIRWHYWLMDAAPVGQLVWYFYLFWMLAVCMAAAWINYDGNRLPIRLVVVSGLAALLIPALSILAVVPYFQSALQMPLAIPFTSPPIEQWLANWLPLTKWQTNWGSQDWQQAMDTTVFKVIGGLFGAAVGLMISMISLTAFSPRKLRVREHDGMAPEPEGLPSESLVDRDRRPVEVTGPRQSGPRQRGVTVVEACCLFCLAGLFAGPLFVLVMASLYFLTVLVLTPMLLNSRLSPLRTPWFVLPYVFLVSVSLWRMTQALLLP